jgi:hypothetical protein
MAPPMENACNDEDALATRPAEAPITDRMSVAAVAAMKRRWPAPEARSAA